MQYRPSKKHVQSSTVNPSIDTATENVSQHVDSNLGAGPAALFLVEQHARGLRSPQLAGGQSSSPASSVADVPRLGDLLRIRCEKAAFSDHSEVYLPNGALETLIRPDTVKQELEAQFPSKDTDEIDRFVATICGGRNGSNPSYHRVFAIIALAEALDCLEKILDPRSGISDKDLPLQRVDSNDMQEAHLRRVSDLDTPIRCFKRWTFNKIKLFDDWQWSLQAPILERVSENYPTFPVRAPLPVRVKMSPGEGGGIGAFSEVFKVKLHPKHHPFSPDNEDVS